MTANGRGGPREGQKSASAIVETANGHSERASEPDKTGSSLKIATGTAETVCGQKGSVKSPGESTLFHETANGWWSESATHETGHATHQTASGHNNALHDPPHHAREKTVNGGSGPW